MIFRNNLDYEFALFDPHYQRGAAKYQKMVEAFEYVYFFMEKAPSQLLSRIPYEKDYLSYLQDLGMTLPQFVKEEGPYKNWWGDLENLELERHLNSKLTSTRLAMTHGWCHPQTSVVSHWEEILHHIHSSSYPSLVLKVPYLMAGAGFCWINKGHEGFQDRLQSWYKTYRHLGPFIIEPSLDLAIVLGITCGAAERAIYENHCSGNGTYRGGMIFENQEDFFPYLDHKYSRPLRDQVAAIWEESRKIETLYREMGAKRSFGLDAFVYREGGQFQKYSLGEVNYRRTMGQMLLSLRPLLPQGGVGQWTIYPKKKIKSLSGIGEFLQVLGSYAVRKQGQTGVIMTSPSSGQFLSFFFLASNTDHLGRLQNHFHQKFLS